MKRLVTLLTFLAITLGSSPLLSKESLTFIAPEGWHLVAPDTLPEHVNLLVKGVGKRELPPSINLAEEEISISLKQYLESVKAVQSRKGEWKKLGTIKTNAGPAILTQFETKSSWGNVRIMQAILRHNEKVYVLTTTALKSEFPQYYKEFFQAIQSLKVTESPFPELDLSHSDRLEEMVKNLKIGFEVAQQHTRSQKNLSEKELNEVAFEQVTFQNKHWKPFHSELSREFNDMGAAWQGGVLQRVQNELYELR